MPRFKEFLKEETESHYFKNKDAVLDWFSDYVETLETPDIKVNNKGVFYVADDSMDFTLNPGCSVPVTWNGRKVYGLPVKIEEARDFIVKDGRLNSTVGFPDLVDNIVHYPYGFPCGLTEFNDAVFFPMCNLKLSGTQIKTLRGIHTSCDAGLGDLWLPFELDGPVLDITKLEGLNMVRIDKKIHPAHSDYFRYKTLTETINLVLEDGFDALDLKAALIEKGLSQYAKF